MSKPKTINFYLTTGRFGEFSNFAAFPIRLKGREWPTAEHYFQAQKFAGTPHEEAVRIAPSPRAAAKMARERSRPLRKDWESVKDDIMRGAVLAKFEQHPKLRELLLSTGDAAIVEHTTNDSYWGDGGDGSGQNMLGQILMETRDLLRNVDDSPKCREPVKPVAQSGEERDTIPAGSAPNGRTSNPLEMLSGFAGNWRGKYRLFLDPKGKPDESTSSLTITLLLRGSFLRIDQTWAFQGKPQEGSMLVGFDEDGKQVSLHWIDTFHMGRKVMACIGAAGEGTAIDVLGSYAAPPGPDWGWRIVLDPKGKTDFEIRMFNIDPDGTEQLAVHATYKRA